MDVMKKEKKKKTKKKQNQYTWYQFNENFSYQYSLRGVDVCADVRLHILIPLRSNSSGGK